MNDERRAVHVIGAKVVDDTYKRKPIFDRKTVAQPSPGFVQGRVERARRKRNPAASRKPLSLQEKKSGTQICCCKCKETIKASRWAKHLSKPCHAPSLIRTKAKSSKKSQPVTGKSNDSHAEEKQAKKTACPKCGKSLTALAMEIHVGGCRPIADLSSPDFPFVLLPQTMPGDVIDQIKRHFQNEPSGRHVNCEWQLSRFRELQLLNPKLPPHLGLEQWHGYCVFEFPHTHRVVLENGFPNNATYVLGANWRDLISLTKPEIRKHDHVKINHAGNYWLRRIDRALRNL